MRYHDHHREQLPELILQATWKAMYNGIYEMIDNLMEHISLENNVLFPRALAAE